MTLTVSPFVWRILLRRTVALQASRRNFAELKQVRRNEFGSIHQTDIPIEKPMRPKRDFDRLPSSSSRNRTRVLSINAIRKKPETVDVSSEQSGIECSRRDFSANRYEDGQLVLFSRHWDKNKYKDQWIKIRKVNKQAKSTIPDAMCSWDEFVPDLLDPSVADSLKRLEFRQPTDIQGRMLKYFHSDNHLFLAAETGSGKTVAYAAPLISYLSHQKRRNKPFKVVVVVATSTLSHQTAAVLSILAEGSGIRVSSAKNEGEAESTSWDLLVGTPGLVAKALQNLPKEDTISHLVLDEADILLDESFVDVITDILSVVPVAYSETNLTGNRDQGAKVIFCSASCPEDLECIVEGVVDRRKLSYVKSEGLHKLLPSVDLTFIRMREMDKFERLCKLVDNDMKRGEQNQTIVFCKDKKTAKFVETRLLESGREALLWQSRCSPIEAEDARVIVATDVASRGLDLPRLSHVIQYDMAKHAVDFVHRMGRVGRLSSLFAGRVTSFVRTAPEIRVTNQIELAARRGKPLHSIETDIAGMLERKKGGKQEEEEQA